MYKINIILFYIFDESYVKTADLVFFKINYGKVHKSIV